MKRQIFVIHGGTVFNEYAEYLAFLKNRPMTLKDLQRVDWKNTLPETLGEPYDVFVPRQPNPTNARYIEWKIWFFLSRI